MRFTEFKNAINEGKEFPVCLFEGEDAFFRNRGLSLIKEKFLTEPNLNFATFEGNSDLSGIEASLSSFSFFGGKRITCIKEFYPDAKILKGFLSNYFSNPNLDSIIVILNEKPCEALKKFSAITVIDCNKQDVSSIVKWIKAEMNREGVKVEGETASLIAEYCQNDMTRINTETQKLIAFAGKGGKIDIEDVNEMVYKSSEYKIYEMTEYIGKKKFDKAINVISEMLLKNETSQRILISIYNYFRRLLHVAISDKSSKELAELLGIKEFAVSKAKEQAKYFKPKALKQAVDQLSNVDYLIKSGRLDADEAMWLSIFKIMAE